MSLDRICPSTYHLTHRALKKCVYLSTIRTDVLINIIQFKKFVVGTANEYTISIIDNEHSKTAGLTGLYGTLSVKTEEILVTDPHTGKIKVTLHWTQIHCSNLPLPAVTEDLHKVCTIRTNR